MRRGYTIEMEMADLVVQALSGDDQSSGTADHVPELWKGAFKTARAVVDTLERLSPAVKALELSGRILIV